MPFVEAGLECGIDRWEKMLGMLFESKPGRVPEEEHVVGLGDLHSKSLQLATLQVNVAVSHQSFLTTPAATCWRAHSILENVR